MDKHERGPLDTFEVIWNSGHVEQIDAHQVLMPPDEMPFGLPGAATRPARGWAFHGEIDGKWRLLLSAPAEDIKSVRNVTYTRDRARTDEVGRN